MIKENPLTISVPEAGWKFLGLSRNGSYAAARRGDIPTVQIGRLLRVPIKAMDAKLEAASFAPTRRSKAVEDCVGDRHDSARAAAKSKTHVRR